MFWVGVVNAILLALLCLILISRTPDNTKERGNTALGKQSRQSTEQTGYDNHSLNLIKRDVEPAAEAPQTPNLQGQYANDPLPLEWEGPVIAVLNNNYQSGDERNKALIAMALQTAKHVPRVQQECLMHLAYALKDNDYDLFLKLSTDISIPINVRLKFVDEVFAIRPKELTKWLGQSLRMTSDPALISRAQDFLKRQEEMELFYSSQPEPQIQDVGLIRDP